MKYFENMFLLKPSILLVGEAPGYKGCVYFGSRLIKGFKMSWLEITSGYATAYKLNPIYEYVSMVEKKERIDIFFDVLFSSDVCKKKSFFSAKLLIT